MKKKILSGVLAASMVLAQMPAAMAASFDDTAGHWGEKSIERWSDHGIVNGSDGLYRPDDNMTRAEMAVVVAKLLGLKDKAENTFADVEDDAWYAEAMLQCAKAGIILGDGKGMNPNATITRQESTVILARALGIQPAEGSVDFHDGTEVADWAAGYVKAMTDKGIINGMGDNSFAPVANINRASVVTILDKSISTYANTSGATVEAKPEGITLIAAPDVTVTGAAEDVLVSDGAAGSSVKVENATVSGTLTVAAPEAAVTLTGETKVDSVAVAASAEEAKVTVDTTATAGTITTEAPKAEVAVAGKVETVSVAATAEAAKVTVDKTATAGEIKTEAPKAEVAVAGKVETVAVAASAEEAKVTVDKTATAGEIKTEAPKAEVAVSGKVDTVSVAATAEAAKVTVDKTATAGEIKTEAPKTEVAVSGKVDSVTVGNAAADTKVQANSGSTITSVDNKAEGTTVSGSGKVENVTTSGDNTTVSTPGTKVEASEGTSGTTAGGKDVVGGGSTTTKPSTPSGGGGGSSHSHSYTYTDNGDGTHTGKCSANDSTLDPAAHTYADGKCTVCGAEAEGKTASVKNIDNVVSYYGTLADAITAAGVGDTVYLLEDISIEPDAPVTIVADSTIILDLNGKVITENGDGARKIVNRGTLTIKDSASGGEIRNATVGEDGQDGAYGLIDNFGTLTIENGKFTDVAHGNGSSFRNRAGAVLTIHGGTFVNTADDSKKQSSGYTGAANAFVYSDGTSLTITGGDFTMTQAMYTPAIKVAAGTTATIDGATITTYKSGGIEVNGGTLTISNTKISVADTNSYYANALAVSNDGTANVQSGSYTGYDYGVYIYSSGGIFNISGGVFEAGTAVLKADNDDYAPKNGSKINVSGGSFTGKYAIAKGNAELVVAGGTFSVDPSEYVAPNYAVTRNDDNSYTVFRQFDGGTGTENDPYQIASADQLKAFRDSVNDGNSYSGKFIQLTADIDLNHEAWTPIGQTGGYSAKTYFQGTFDGNGKTISNLNIPASTWEAGSDEGEHFATGFFGFIDAGSATIENVTFDRATVEGHHWVGVAAGYMTGTVSGVKVTNSTITSTYKNGEADGDKAGGVAGYLNGGSITGCTVTGSTITAVRDCGGVVGYSVANTTTSGNTVKNSAVYYSTENAEQIGGEIMGNRSPGTNTDNTATNVTVAKVNSSTGE